MSLTMLGVYGLALAVASALAMELRAAAARLHYGIAIADDAFLEVQPRGYQDALTDPAGNKWAILTYGLTVATWIAAGLLLRWYHVPLVMLTMGITASVVSRFLWSPDDPRRAMRFHASLCRREADYRRDGDILRADACVEVRRVFEGHFLPDGSKVPPDFL